MPERHENIATILDTIRALIGVIGVDGRVGYEESIGRGLVFNINTKDSRLLIGKQGANLYALEHLVHSMVAKNLASLGESIRFSVDVNEYKKGREYRIKELVKEAVDDLKSSQTEIILPEMNKSERRFVHNYIQDQFPHLNTESVGNEPFRKVKISI